MKSRPRLLDFLASGKSRITCERANVRKRAGTLLAASFERAPTHPPNSVTRDLAVNKWTLEPLEHCRLSRGRDTLFLKRDKLETNNQASGQRSRIFEHLSIAMHNISAAGDRDLPPSPEEETRVTLTSHSPVFKARAITRLTPAKPLNATDDSERSGEDKARDKAASVLLD